MFPIYILDGKEELPKEGTYYVVAQDGIYLSKDTGLIRAMVKVERISFLQKLDAKAELRLPKISSEVIVQILLFFRRVFEKHHSEAGILLYYSKEKNEYLVDAPVQEVSATAVDYEIESRLKEGYDLVGTIHSHCDFGAFHSGIDIHDEKDFDGIHITIGRVDQPYFTISCSAVVNNNRFEMNPEDLIFGIDKVDFVPKLVTNYKRQGVQQNLSYQNTYKNEDWFSKALGNGFDYLVESGYHKRAKQQFYDLILPEGKDYRSYPFPKEWLSRVSKRTYIAPVANSINPINGIRAFGKKEILGQSFK